MGTHCLYTDWYEICGPAYDVPIGVGTESTYQKLQSTS
jgi:hypothetical protein